MAKKVGKKPQVRTYSPKPKAGAFDTNQVMFYGGLVALAGVAVGGYYWMSSIQAAQQAQQQVNAAQKPGSTNSQCTSRSRRSSVYH